ncbi:hypothetical protein GQX73_g6516 [Xylaria multiplex]|uniref:Uncharacterized protein n=1 Tax=Xylaria multiplex TaxID=323545 RepID=A0A7C8IZ38_9PEZI|nr:hypothetical protein GQX73_g6516 [Xylaria multiplex]
MRRPLAEIDATAGSPDSDPDDYIPEKDVSVGIIQFKEGQPFNENCDKGGLIWGKFPDQKTCVQSLLREGKSNNPDENVLHKGRISIDPSRVRYFHIPSNIMTWAEEAISRYFGEERPDFASFQRQLRREEKSRSSIILQDRYWHGQLHADERGSLHARYMSPIFPGNTDLVPNNLVLFMPYLHWETSRKREYFALEMERIMAADSERKEKDEEDKRSERIRQLRRTDTENEPKSQQNPTRWATAYNRAKTGLRTLRTMTFTKTKGLGICAQDDASSIERSIHQVALVVMKKPPFKIQAPLAKYLMAVSKLHEGMANYRDKMLLRKYLPGNPPLHPRRTLDQAFYWTLRTTKERDCDQVVFRGTTAKPDEFHRFDYEKKKWPKHEEFKIEGNCTECKLNIQKLSRVIMVDQLWMWILDANTIITCFPKRYGANKNDALGIHKSIRSRVEESGPVHTVFELGLIIIDECSKTFFDRTKTLDRRPQAIDEFSIAIGNIMHKQTVAFKRLWWWTEQAKSVYCSTGYINTSNFHMSLLDINPEGHLEREIEDIVEELDIMLHISNTHNDILRRFVEQAERILDPKDEFKGSHRSQQRRKSETDSSLSESEKEERRQREKVYRCFKQRAEEGQARAMDHIAELKKLRESAKKTADDVLHLLFMKQQQASVFQAWQAMKQSDETIKQGRSIMTFTLVTIVFLPLSFLSSVFGMNNKEFGDNTWSISQQILYIFHLRTSTYELAAKEIDAERWNKRAHTEDWSYIDFLPSRLKEPSRATLTMKNPRNPGHQARWRQAVMKAYGAEKSVSRQHSICLDLPIMRGIRLEDIPPEGKKKEEAEEDEDQEKDESTWWTPNRMMQTGTETVVATFADVAATDAITQVTHPEAIEEEAGRIRAINAGDYDGTTTVRTVTAV